MPELPEVETVVRGLRPDVVGRTITAARVEWGPQVVKMPPDLFTGRLAGQRIQALRRRGKYIIFKLSDDVLIIHLKMTGRLYVLPASKARPDEDRWVRASFMLDNSHVLYFSDLRKFGRLYLTIDEKEVTGSLGPEPLSDDFTLEWFTEQLARRSGTIKPLLMNQQFIAGIGNIYADESLWISLIDPRRKADTLKPEEIKRLYHATRQVLQDGIDHEGASVNWYRKPDGTEGEQQDHFNVYGREDQPCLRCGSPIHKIKLHQRGTHFCPVCQK